MAKYGIIYIAHNPRDGEHLFKVGKTERFVDERMVELTADTSNIGTYEAKAVFVVRDVDAAETACHKRLNRHRVQPNREFFELELDRLVRAVREETQRFAATIVIPEPASAQRASPTPKSPLERIEKAKQERAKAKGNLDKAVTEAQSKLERSFVLIRERVTTIRDELVAFEYLTWEIASDFEEARDAKPPGTICSVMFRSKFSGDPPILKISGLKGGIYGEPDLSRAIEEPKECSSSIAKKEDWKFVEWKEVDDGRYGRIEVYGDVIASEPHLGTGQVRLVFGVRAVAIKYDDYHNNWDEHARSKIFPSPEEALEAFEELIVGHASQPTVDVRTVGDQITTRRGRTFRKIYDQGHFFLNDDILNE